MKISFFSEAGFIGKTPRNFNNSRTEYAWYIALEADHYSIGKIPESKYDIGIVILPKKNLENIHSSFIIDLKKSCTKVAVMQEGPNWYWQDYTLEIQLHYLNFLSNADFILCHNKLDEKYYEGLTNKPTYHMPSLMIEDTLKDIKSIERKNIMIGGNLCSWYNGIDSFIVAHQMGSENDIYVPSMGRKIAGEERLDGLNHLPYMNWTEWIYKLHEFKYGIHLMRTHEAGTFALNCAFLGIPCIGYSGLDTQEILHPHTTIGKIGDLVTANHLARRLKEDKSFYQKCADDCITNYHNFYREDRFKKLMLTTFKNILENENINNTTLTK